MQLTSSPRLLPSNRYQGRRDLPDAPLRRKQIELRRRIPRILYLKAYAEVVEVFANSRRNRRDVRSGADDE
jgi:hypothetical protein